MDCEKTPLLKNVVISISTESCEIIEHRNYIALTYDELEQYIHNTTWYLIRIFCAIAYWLCFIFVLITAYNISAQSARTCYKNTMVDNITVLIDPTNSDGLAVSTAKTIVLTTLGVTRSPPVI